MYTYMKLKRSYIIFLCAFDPFDKDEKIYTFNNRCREIDDLELGDNTTKIF